MNIRFVTSYCIFLMIPVVIFVYYFIPVMFYRFDKKRFQAGHETGKEGVLVRLFTKIPVSAKWKKYLILRIQEAGIGDQNTWVYWTSFMVFLPVVIFTALSLQNYSMAGKIAVCVMCVILPNLYLNSQIEKRKKAFIVNAYKLYYFLHSQISSGIKVTDAIKGLYEIADHPLIQTTFIKFVAQYELTLNMDESLQILRKAFSGYDCEMLCVSIQQCVNTGMAGKTLLKMEEMMFSKYFNYLQKDTEKFKTKLFISGIFAIVPLVMIFLLPVVYEAVQGFGAIMDTNLL